MDIVFGFFLVSILLFVRPQKDKVDYMSVGNILPLRGIMAVLIILHHFSEKIVGGRFFPLLQHAGYLIVAIFFFLSGYGLMFSYNIRGKEYLKDFLKNRVLYLVIVYLLVTALYAVYHIIIGDFRFSLTIAENSWYIWIQIILYIFFWFSFKFFGGKSKKTAICSIFVLQVLLTILLIFAGFADIWYISNFAFIFGIFISFNKTKIDFIIKKYYLVFAFSSFVLFAVFSILPTVIGFYTIFRMLSTVSFCLVFMSIIYVIRITSKFWSSIGKFSLEIYLLHGFVYMFLHRFISNDVLWIIVTLVITIPLSYSASLINTKIKKLLKTYRQ